MKALLISLQRNLNIIGLKSIHHFLLDHGHDSTLLYLNRFDPASQTALQKLRAFLNEQRPDMFGISLTSSEYESAKSITSLLKKWFPALPVIWGGTHPTVAPKTCFPHADYICVGEGEHVMLDIANAIERGESPHPIDNLCYLAHGSIHANPVRPLEQDLDTFPVLTQLPPHSYIQAEGPVEPLTVGHLRRHKLFQGGFYRTIISRGCPMHCTYCINSRMLSLYPDWGLRWRSVEHVMSELERATKEGPPVAYVAFADDCLLGCSLDYLKDFCAQYKARVGVPFLAKGTPACITKERMDLMVDAGMALLSVGMQSGSDRVCAEVYQRPVLQRDFMRAARLIKGYTVAPYYDVILDNPFETPEEDLETVEAIMAIPKPFFLQVFSLVFYRGTKLRERAERECPEKIGDAERKQNYWREKSPINDLKVMAAYMHTPLMRRLVNTYKRNPDALRVRLAIAVGRTYCRLFMEPITQLRLLRLSCKGSTWQAVRQLPRMIDFRMFSIFDIFQRGVDTTKE